MRASRVTQAWIATAVLAVATVVVAGVSGYRADEASVIADGEAVLRVPQWTAAAWMLLAAAGIMAVAAVALTVSRTRPGDSVRVAAPVALIIAGIVGAVVFLPLATLSVGGAAWLVARSLAPSPQPTR